MKLKPPANFSVSDATGTSMLLQSHVVTHPLASDEGDETAMCATFNPPGPTKAGAADSVH